MAMEQPDFWQHAGRQLKYYLVRYAVQLLKDLRCHAVILQCKQWHLVKPACTDWLCFSCCALSQGLSSPLVSVWNLLWNCLTFKLPLLIPALWDVIISSGLKSKDVVCRSSRTAPRMFADSSNGVYDHTVISMYSSNAWRRRNLIQCTFEGSLNLLRRPRLLFDHAELARANNKAFRYRSSPWINYVDLS